ncbi:MAG: calcium/sodium antiporter [Thermoanaerobaculia bacterium]
MTLLAFLVGIVLLVVGADLLVRGASRLSLSIGLSPLIVGLTVVSFGTSAPELAVSMKAAFAGTTEMAFGNVVGSNICNVLLILGLAALAAPLEIAPAVLRRDLPVLLALSLLTALLASDGRLGAVDGLVLLAGGLAHAVVSIRQERRGPDAAAAEAPLPVRRHGRLLDGLSILAGLVLLVAGADLLVGAAVKFARAAGVSDLVVGLTVVAVGTSLPEIAASVLASLRGARDIAVGNVVGSNVLNLAIVLALTAIVAPGGVVVPAEALRFDTPVMLAAAFLCLPVFLRDRRVSRGEGLLFVLLYALYTTWIALKAQESPHLAWLQAVVLFVVLPTLAVGVLVWSFRAARRLRRNRSLET